MKRREPRKTDAYFENVVRYYEGKVASYAADLETRPPQIQRWDNVHMLQAGNYDYLLRATYSLGHPVASLHPLFDGLIHHWHAWVTWPGIEAENKVRIDAYLDVLRYCSLAVLLEASGATLEKLQAAVRLQQIDPVLARFAAYVGVDLPAQRKLFFKKAFEPLNAVFESTDKEAALRAYLSAWRQRMKASVYEGAHAITVNDTAFVGYWSFEAAAIAVKEGLPTSELQAMAYFPADLT